MCGSCWPSELLRQSIATLQVAAAIRKMEVGIVIHLAGGAQWLDFKNIASSDLYVRACYPQLLEASKQFRKAEDSLNSPILLTYTGTPGKPAS